LTDFSPKVRVEIVAPDDKVDEIVQIIRENCRTGKRGDGILWITETGSFERIRIE
jgi:nitrogen regulatory protein P-II 1